MSLKRYLNICGICEICGPINPWKTKIPPENRRDLKYSHEKQTLNKDKDLY
jgi:hypothetical protein